MKLKYIDEESNNDNNIERNYIRNLVAPTLEQQWPAFKNNIIRTAAHCHQQNKLISMLIKPYLTKCITDNKFNINEGKELDKELLAEILRSWICNNGYYPPSTKQIQEIIIQFFHCKVDSKTKFVTKSLELYKYRDLIFINPIKELNLNK